MKQGMHFRNSMASSETFKQRLSDKEQSNLRSWFDLNTVILFLIPLSQPIEVTIGGRLLGPDILLCSLFPFLFLIRWHLIRGPLPRTFLYLLSVWFLEAVITDLIRETPEADLIRGWAKILVFGVDFVSLFMLIAYRMQRLLAYLVGYACGTLLLIQFNPSELIQEDPWKFGYAWPVTLFFLFVPVFLPAGLKVFAGAFFAALAAILNLILNFRSMFGVTVLAWLLTGLSEFAHWAKMRRSIVAWAVVFLVFGYGTVMTYEYLAGSGALGETVREKYETTATGDFGLLAGRGEIFASSQAIMDSPIIGHGSWAHDLVYVILMERRLESAGYEIGDSGNEDLIPSHSYIFGAWVEAGIAGAVFWAWVLYVVGRALYLNLSKPGPLATIFSFLFIGFIWDIVFSPFGLDARFFAPARLIAAMLIITQAGGIAGPPRLSRRAS